MRKLINLQRSDFFLKHFGLKQHALCFTTGHLGLHQLKELEGSVAMEELSSGSSPPFSRSKSYSQSLISPVQFPDGQRYALMAVHFPSQLAPKPQVFTSTLWFAWQHVTLIDLLALERASSKKALVFAVGNVAFPVVISVGDSVVELGSVSLLIKPHSFKNIVVFT